MFNFMAGLLGLTSTFVFVEPAPFDVLVLAMGFIALIRGKLTITRVQSDSMLPLFLVTVFITINIGGLVAQGVFSTESLKFFFITLYLSGYFVVLSFIKAKISLDLVNTFFSGMCISAFASTLFGIIDIGSWIPSFTTPIQLFVESIAGPTPYSVGSYDGVRISGFFKDPNVYGPFLVPLIFYSLLRMSEGNVRPKIVWLATSLFFSLGVLLSFSRGAWLNLFVTGVIFTFFIFVGKKSVNQVLKSTAIFFSVSLVIFLLLFFYFSDLNSNSLDSIAYFIERLSFQPYDEDRFAAQDMSFRLALDYPWGIGPGRSEQILQMANHSLFARIALENGVVGCVCIICFLITTLVYIFRNLRTSYGNSYAVGSILFASIVGIIANSVIVDTLHWRHLWLLLALSWNTKLINQENDEFFMNRHMTKVGEIDADSNRIAS